MSIFKKKQKILYQKKKETFESGSMKSYFIIDQQQFKIKIIIKNEKYLLEIQELKALILKL